MARLLFCRPLILLLLLLLPQQADNGELYYAIRAGHTANKRRNGICVVIIIMTQTKTERIILVMLIDM